MRSLRSAILIGIAVLVIAWSGGAQAPPRQRSKARTGSAAPKSPPAPTASKQAIPLPTSKVLYEPVLGAPQRTNSFPATAAVSPDKRYVAFLNQGWSLPDSKYQQSIAILDLQTNQLTDCPDPRFGRRQRVEGHDLRREQSYFFGLAWSGSGNRLYASVGSLADPTGTREGNTGSGIAMYRFENGGLTPERFIKLALQPLAAGKRRPTAFKNVAEGFTPPYPAGLAVVPGPGGERLLVADNYGDAAMLLEPESGTVVTRFDLSSHVWVPAEFPLTVLASRDGKRAWVSLWNASRVVELDLAQGKVARHIDLLSRKRDSEAGSHPTALLLSRDEKLLFVALANADAVAVVDTASLRLVRLLTTQLPQQQYGGVYPVALALSDDGRRLYVADAAADAVAVFNATQAGTPLAALRPAKSPRGAETQPPAATNPWLQRLRPLGFIPTEWYPTALAVVGDDLVVATAKGKGTTANNARWNTQLGTVTPQRVYPYIYALLAGSVARISLREAQPNLAALTQEVLDANLMTGRIGAFAFAGGRNPIKHVIYIIKENRSYDQVFGDIREANGDASLVMYGEDITPNHHQLARQFGVLDNFYVSGEVSGDGHVWSDAAIASDYTEANVQINYRNAQRTYDFGGQVLNEIPLEQEIADVNEPGTGYLWSNAARFRVTYRIYGEYVAAQWCTGPERIEISTEQPRQPGACDQKTINKGDPLPAHVGDPKGGPSPWPWAIPVMTGGIATKPEIRGHFDPRFPNFNTSYPDQLRADEFLNEFAGFVRARQEGRKADALPALIVMQLPNDHTAGTRPHEPKPAAAVADNDIALGRVVEAVSHSPYWDDTAIFVLEDDAQNGPDHVDAHRSPALVISKYSPRGENGAPFVDRQFHTTVNLIRTMEALLGLPPMNNNDARAALMTALFTGQGDQAPTTTDWRNRENGLLYQVNPANAPGAAVSLGMDFSQPDAIDSEVLNAILWREAKGDAPMPAPRYTVIPRGRGRE